MTVWELDDDEPVTDWYCCSCDKPVSLCDCAPQRAVRPCRTTTPEPHELGEFPMSCYSCHVEADS